MTRKTMLALLAQADTTLEDNTAGGITPADIRAMVKDIVDSFCPGYGAATSVNLTMAALGTTPRAIPYQTKLAETAEFVVVLNAGTIKRLAQGLPTTVNRVSFYADVAAASGAEVSFALYRNGAAVPGAAMTVTGQGIGNFSLAAFTAGLTSLDGQDYVYEVRAAKISGATDDVQLSNVRFVVEVVPTIGI
jgi:hypothetical protein